MKVLALVDAPDHVCCRYRVRAFAEALAAAGWSLTLEGLARGALARPRQLLKARQFDAVILQRKLLNPWEMALLRRSSRRLIFDLDDAVFWRDSYHPKGVRSPARERRFASLVRQADVVLAGNDFLVGRALLAGAAPEAVRRLPTCIDPGRCPTRSHAEGSPVRLVWIGSSSTLRGLEQQRDLWDRIGRAVPGVILRVICDRAPEFGALPVEFVPWSDANEGQALAECDIGLAWLPDDLWSRGKCGLKVLQYLAAGLPVVANPIGVHPEMIAQDHSGILAVTEDDWLEAVARLAGDWNLRRRMGAAARATVEKSYAVDRWTSTFVNAMTGSLGGMPTRPHFDAIGVGRSLPSGRVEGTGR
ncbi:glycosyltransferase [Tautonia rosea]|uniref:glycosyltransferase n=1 Tax=Tautonia rosea TaxID=2728037 RepID=UPI001473313A|nr:glycosyltransferase [Tautonia rosea]